MAGNDSSDDVYWLRLAHLADLRRKGRVKMRNTITRRNFLKSVGFGAATLSTCLHSDANAASKNKPNIIFMVADNLGREAVGFYEADATEVSNVLKIKTPHLDRLASQGVIFDNCLIGTPLCGPARCGWDTGRHAYRVGLNDQTNPHRPDGGLSPEEITTLSEFSLKVICNARWNGRIPAGTRVHTPWLHLDLYAVFATLAGTEIPRGRVINAENVWPLFEGREAKHDRMLCWTFKNEDAIRMEDLKLRMKDGKVLGLFDLADDPDEEKDIASAHLEKVKRMRELHAKWKKECEAQQTNTTDPNKK